QAWGRVKDFVGGIGSWIKEHKGPLSYDKKLLIPAGLAIMGGLNDSLQDGFQKVKQTISGVAGEVQGMIMDGVDTSKLLDDGWNPQLSYAVLSSDSVKTTQPKNKTSAASKTDPPIIVEVYTTVELDKKVVSKEIAEPVKIEIDGIERRATNIKKGRAK
ncbi:hypothetical protein P8631_12610, partial [Guyparkeria sp. 1SP6A2]|nr:hypothetical protein [Guyparkeria sp. 1SP6A2]